MDVSCPESDTGRYLYENHPDMYASVDAGTTLVEHCNNTMAHVLGYDREDIIGQSLFQIYHSDSIEEAKKTFKLFIQTGKIRDRELQLQKKDGSILDVSQVISAEPGENGGIKARLIMRDISATKIKYTIFESRMHLMQFAINHSLDELLEETLNKAEELTDSSIGFYHFVSEDQKSLTLQNWSTRTKTEFCSAEGKGLHYNIADAGVWVDCVYQRKPVVHNDYASLPHRKGMPKGHAGVMRELVVPVFRKDKIKAILGLGNKPSDYREKDVEAVSLLADLAWEIAERKLMDEALYCLNRRLRAVSSCNQILVRATDEQSLLNDICRTVCDEAGYHMAWVGYAEKDEAKTVRPVAWAGFEDGYLADANITWADTERGRGPTGTAIRSGQSVYIQDFKKDPRAAPWRKNALLRDYRSSIALPLKNEKGGVFGVLNIYSSTPDAFIPDEIRLLEELAEDLAFGINVIRTRIERTQAEERLSLTLEALNIGIWDWDIKNDQWYASPVYYSMMGYAPVSGEADRREWLERVHPDDRAMVLNKIQDVLTRDFNSYQYEARILHADGSYRWVHVEGFGIERDAEGKPKRVIGIRKDVTDRKQNEVEIEHLKNYLANIVDSMPSMLVGIDSSDTVSEWNLQAEKVTGIPAQEARGRRIREVIPEFSYWIDSMKSEIRRRRTASVENALIEREGERYFYDMMGYPLISDGDEGAVIRIDDVTEKSRIRELMIQTEKMLSLGGLAAGMAHEINNPLGIITQAIHNIERRVSPDLPANRKTAEEMHVSLDAIKGYFEKRQILQFMSSIREASSRAMRIINNMLRFSRRSETIMQKLSLESIIEQALELAGSDYILKKSYDFRDIKIIRDFAPDMPDVPIIPGEIEQVILNLLKNAAQAMVSNPPDRMPRITLRLRLKGKYALLEVEDNGPGMDDNIRLRVFEPFFTTKAPDVGTGLGLSVSYMIITQNHKGLIEVKSIPGKGACFKIRLPLSGEGVGT